MQTHKEMIPSDTVLKGQDAFSYVEKVLGSPIKELLIFPKFFMLETINVCNARCVMCGIGFNNKKKAVMSDTLFNKIAEELAQYREQVKKVMLYLDGEPLLDKKMPFRIKKMKKAGIKIVNIATNASLLDQRVASGVIDAGLDQVYITLDSLKKDVFETIRKGLEFETVYKNILNFIKLRDKINPKLNIRIQMILQELNQCEEDAFVKHWPDFLSPHDQVVVQKAHNWGARVNIMRFGDEETINNVPCISLWGSFCIHVDGVAGLCCMDTNSNLVLGNVNTQSIAEIWASGAIERAREKHALGKRAEISLCDGCTVWRDTKHDREKIIGAH